MLGQKYSNNVYVLTNNLETQLYPHADSGKRILDIKPHSGISRCQRDGAIMEDKNKESLEVALKATQQLRTNVSKLFSELKDGVQHKEGVEDPSKAFLSTVYQNLLSVNNTFRYVVCSSTVRLFIWGFTSFSTLYRSYHEG